MKLSCIFAYTFIETNMNNVLTKAEFKKQICDFFKKESGMSVTQAKKKIQSQMIVDKWGNLENESIKAGNVRVYFCNNPNYCGGIKNGFGKGWYISNVGFTGGANIKI